MHPRSSLPLFSLCSRCLRECQKNIHVQASALQKLIEVGKFENPKTSGHYQPGQFFLHRVFGYRGIILFPWVARMYDRDVNGRESKHTTWEENGVVYDHVSGMRPETRNYYQALIDHRDFPYIRAQPEAITYLAEENNSSFYSIPGLDYVSHEDILPYTCSGPESFFNHELFGQFFIQSGSREAPLPSDLLRLWHEKNHHWLEMSDVHRETTNRVRITVMPFFMGSRQVQQSMDYWWRYNIRIENLSGERVQLRERHWKIYSLSGTLETVKGRGVVGQEPILSSSQPAFQYSSHVTLQSPSGHMWGTFRLERADRQMFDVRVPPFSLDSHKTLKSV